MADFDSIAAYMEDVLCGEKHVPGCDIIVMQNHKQLYRHLCGYSVSEEKIPLTENNLYYMYSCTKPMTVTAGMRLVEEGKLDLDAPISRYLPEFADVYLLRDGVPCPPKKAPTIKNLFTMTAGFDYSLRNDETAPLIAAGADTRAIIGAMAKRPLSYEPGDHFQYSMCHDILAAVIEEAAGMRYSEYMKKVIFDPLGMADSTCHAPTAEMRARLAGQYSCSTRVVLRVNQENSFQLTPEYESGGASLVSSTADYAKFADTLACGGTSADGYRLLKPETVKMMHTEQLSHYVMNGEFSCAAGNGYGYGLGVRTRINQDDGQRSPIGEFGWDGAAGAYVLMDDIHGLSISFAMHVLMWPRCIGRGHEVMRDRIYDILGL